MPRYKVTYHESKQYETIVEAENEDMADFTVSFGSDYEIDDIEELKDEEVKE